MAFKKCKDNIKKVKAFVSARKHINANKEVIHPYLFSMESNRLNSLLNL